MDVGVVREAAGEPRVALVPSAVQTLVKKSIGVLVERGAGELSGYPDMDYERAGAILLENKSDVCQRADVLVFVRGQSAVEAPLASRHTLLGLFDPLRSRASIDRLAAAGVTAFAFELLPRITRAQSMDVLSSMANLAGYKSVLLAANECPRVFPMMMTAAGTVAPAHVLILGAGVAGLQAIATAKRLGAVVSAYDVRPEVKEQVQSVGGKFVELGLASEGSDTSGYATAQSSEFIAQQQQRLGEHVRAADVVITTAQVPGKRAPLLVTAAMRKGMRRGSVIVDLAADTGGNVEGTKAGERVVEEGVVLLGPRELAASVPFHASQLFAKNVTTFLLHLVKDGGVQIDRNDEITRATLLCQGGHIVNPRLVKEGAQKTA